MLLLLRACCDCLCCRLSDWFVVVMHANVSYVILNITTISSSSSLSFTYSTSGYGFLSLCLASLTSSARLGALFSVLLLECTVRSKPVCVMCHWLPILPAFCRLSVGGDQLSCGALRNIVTAFLECACVAMIDIGSCVSSAQCRLLLVCLMSWGVLNVFHLVWDD